MNRRIHRGALFATLLLWQLGFAMASQGSVIEAVPADAANGLSAHCHVHPQLGVANDAARATADVVPRANGSGPNGKPACCAPDACKCGGAPASAAATSSGPLAFMALPLHPAPASGALLIAQLASNPFRPPI